MSKSLAELIAKQFDVSTQVIETDITALTTLPASVIAKPNPNRVLLVVSVVGANPVYFSTEKAMGLTSGIFIVGTGGYLSFKWRDDFMMPSYGLYGVAVTGNSVIHVVELLIN